MKSNKLLKFKNSFISGMIISLLLSILSSVSLFIGTNYVAKNYDYAADKYILKYGYGPMNWGYQWDENGVFLENISKNNREQYNNSYEIFLNEHLKVYELFKEEYKKNPNELNKRNLDIYSSIYISRILIIASSTILSLFLLLFFINLSLVTISYHKDK